MLVCYLIRTTSDDVCPAKSSKRDQHGNLGHGTFLSAFNCGCRARQGLNSAQGGRFTPQLREGWGGCEWNEQSISSRCEHFERSVLFINKNVEINQTSCFFQDIWIWLYTTNKIEEYLKSGIRGVVSFGDSSRATACTTPTFVHQLRLYIDASTSGESSGTRPRAVSVAK